MLKFLFLSALSFSAFSQESILVTKYSGSDLGYATSINAEFAYNEQLGRAWVVTSPAIYDDGAEADIRETVLSQLSFDKTKKAVMYSSNGFETVCANLKTSGRGIFKNSRLVSTGNCKLVEKAGTEIIDPGTNPYSLKTIQVYLNVKR